MKTKGWAIYFKGDKEEIGGICCWGGFDGLAIFETKKNAKKALEYERKHWIEKDRRKLFKLVRCEINVAK